MDLHLYDTVRHDTKHHDTSFRVICHVPFALTWHISQIIIDILISIVITCILNESRGHYLLTNVLNVAIFMSLKPKKEMNHLPLLDALIDDDDFGLTFELGTLVKNIKKEVIAMIDSSVFS